MSSQCAQERIFLAVKFSSTLNLQCEIQQNHPEWKKYAKGGSAFTDISSRALLRPCRSFLHLFSMAPTWRQRRQRRQRSATAVRRIEHPTVFSAAKDRAPRRPSAISTHQQEKINFGKTRNHRKGPEYCHQESFHRPVGDLPVETAVKSGGNALTFSLTRLFFASLIGPLAIWPWQMERQLSCLVPKHQEDQRRIEGGR